MRLNRSAAVGSTLVIDMITVNTASPVVFVDLFAGLLPPVDEYDNTLTSLLLTGGIAATRFDN